MRRWRPGLGSARQRVEVMLNGDGTITNGEDLRSAERSITLQLYYARSRSYGWIRSARFAGAATGRSAVLGLTTAFTVEFRRTTGRAAGRGLCEPFARSAYRRCISRRTAHTSAASSSTPCGWTGGFGSTTSGLATAAATARGAKRMCVSRVRRFGNFRRHSLRHGSRRPG